jgi:tetratricopeptide (TPR) repeat protein
VLVEEGRVAEADRQLGVLRGTLGVDDRERLTRQIAAGWVREGNLDRAAALMAADSTVEGLDLAGRIQVFRGDLAAGAELLRAAGPFAGSRVEASSRLRVLALLQVLAVDSSTGVGLGFLALEQGDTVAAARQLEELVVQFPPLAGGAELGLLAGQLYAALGRGQDAQRLLEQAATSDAPAAAAAAGLELARRDGAQGRRAEAVARLEALILAWPGSAVAPEARRMIDGLRGATPGSR